MRIRHQAAAVAVSLLAALALAGPAFAAMHTVQALDTAGGPPFHFSPPRSPSRLEARLALRGHHPAHGHGIGLRFRAA